MDKSRWNSSTRRGLKLITTTRTILYHNHKPTLNSKIVHLIKNHRRSQPYWSFDPYTVIGTVSRARSRVQFARHLRVDLTYPLRIISFCRVQMSLSVWQPFNLSHPSAIGLRSTINGFSRSWTYSYVDEIIDTLIILYPVVRAHFPTRSVPRTSIWRTRKLVYGNACR